MLDAAGNLTNFLLPAFVNSYIPLGKYNDVYTPDSLTFIADKNYGYGELIKAKSKNNRYPIRHIFK